jgi:hypothetical protein
MKKIPTSRQQFSLGLLMGAVLALSACGHEHTNIQTDTFPGPSFNPPRLARPIIQDAQQVYVSPGVNSWSSARAGVLMFRCPPDLPNVSHPVTQTFMRKLMEKHPFLEMRPLPEPYTSLPEALRLGRERKLDVLVLGEVPYFLDSGTAGQSGIQVDLMVVEVATGRQLWYFTDAVKATPRPMLNLIVVETRPRPTPPLYVLVEQLAGRMVDTLVRGAPAPAVPPMKRWAGAIWQ